MRPIRLEMSAFGPYSGREVIDFSDLNDRNLFLITGPTGSGKTTIFDAISFALYGDTSGSLRTPEGLRSHFAEVDVLTEVQLKFELNGMVYEVVRVPRQDRPKARTEGFTEQKPTATLTIEDGDPRTVITGVSNVNTRIEEVIGINVEQFKQIMMIPQGEFKKLLTSDSKEREKVLQQLFDTTIYRKVQYELNEQARILGGEIKSKRVERDTLASKIKCSEDSELSELINAEDKSIDIIIDKTLEQLKEDKASNKVLDEEKSNIHIEIEKHIKNKEIAIKMNDNIKLFEQIQIDYSDNLKLADEMRAKEERLDKADKASRLVVEENNIKQREIELKELINQEEQNLVTIKALTDKLDLAKTQYNHVNSEEENKIRTELSVHIQQHEGFKSKVQDITIHEEAVKKISSDLEHLSQQMVKSQEKLNTINAEIESKGIKIENLKDSELRLEKLNAKLLNTNSYRTNIVELLGKLDGISKLKQEVSESELALTQHKKLVDVAEEDYKTSKIKFFMNQAAILAKELDKDSPCPVCGSLDHPKLAQATADSISQEALDVLEKDLSKLKLKLTKLGNDSSVINERLSNAMSSFEEQLDIINETFTLDATIKLDEQKRELLVKEKSKINTELDKLNDGMKKLNEDIKLYQSLVIELDKLKLLETSQTKDIKVLEGTISKLKSDLAVHKASLELVLKEVPEQLRTMELLSAAIHKLSSKLKESQDKLKQAEENYTKLNNRHIELSSKSELNKTTIENDKQMIAKLKLTFEDNILKAKFKSFDNYNDSKLSEYEMNILKKEQESYKLECEKLKNKVIELEEETKGQKFVETESFDIRITELKGQREELTSQIGRLTSRIEDNKETIKSIKKINDQIGSREDKYKVVGQLSNISNGKNRAMITFERYVLAAFLEDILKAANIRLKQMTQSRYTLHRTEELSRKNKQSGLELEVFDTYTGKSRHVKTLSGGEGFKASLSMALGLSDVVQSYAGGVRLDTMFIDEGFGTLDQESLDSAINCLIDIQKSGRLVGIISHVQELKERIDTRLEITTSNIGSESKFIVG